MDDRRAGPGPGPQPAPIERIARRHKTFEPMMVLLDGAEIRAHILNVSATGALVHAQPAPGIGAQIKICLPGRSIGALVMWRDGFRFGIAFQGLLRDAEIDRLLDRSVPEP